MGGGCATAYAPRAPPKGKWSLAGSTAGSAALVGALGCKQAPTKVCERCSRLGLTGSIILSILDLWTSEGEQSVCTLPKHKQQLGFLCGLLGVLIAKPACGVLHRRRPNPAPC